MDMEDFVGSSSNEVSQIAKGKRSKRQRLSTPNGAGSSTMIMTCSSSSTASGSGGLLHRGDFGNFSFSSTTSCSYESTGDEEDMANCLILLAQGNSAKQQLVKDGGGKKSTTDKFSSRKLAYIATSNTAFKTGFVVYECKTCNRAFPSFQALGGHRASHKRPKVTVENKSSSPSSPPSVPAPPQQPSDDDDHELELEGGESHAKSNMTLPPAHHHPHHHQVPTQFSLSAIRGMNQSKAKIHECSICGSEFSSGQALGGHMRRHRAATSTGQMAGLNISTHVNHHTTTMNDMDIKSRNNINLELDLNLPAPEEDIRDSSSKFQYAPTQRSLVLPAHALVDCHY